MEIEPTPEERAYAIADYEPTDELPQPDDDWIYEEVAMNRLAILPWLRRYTMDRSRGGVATGRRRGKE